MLRWALVISTSVRLKSWRVLAKDAPRAAEDLNYVSTLQPRAQPAELAVADHGLLWLRLAQLPCLKLPQVTGAADQHLQPATGLALAWWLEQLADLGAAEHRWLALQVERPLD